MKTFYEYQTIYKNSSIQKHAFREVLSLSKKLIYKEKYGTIKK